MPSGDSFTVKQKVPLQQQTSVKFPSRTGTSSHSYAVTGCVRTSKSNHSDLPKQLIRTSHNKAHQYLTEISKNKQGVWFARTDCPTKYLDITPIQVTSDKVQSTIDTKFGWQPAHDCILATGPGKLYRLPFISYHVPSSYSISLWLSQKSAFKNNLKHTIY